jgi:hypothetical protein
MHSILRVGTLLIFCLATLSACATSTPPVAPISADAPAPTLTPNARQQASEAVPTDRVELATGRYQLLMFYSPL